VGVHGVAAEDLIALPPNLLEQAAAVAEPFQRHVVRRLERSRLEVWPVRVLQDAERIECLPEKTASFAGKCPAVHVKQPDEWR
jgi:hypothetical protein